MIESKRRKPEELRSHRWFGQGPWSFGRRSRMLQNGWELDEFVGRPVIAVINTWSDLNTCHRHLRARADDVKRGVLLAGGFPVELPAMSLSERNVAPTTMLYRNFLAMETEELIRCHPVDGAVLLGGCDKTTPALLMGAISADIPSIYVPAGFMLSGSWRGERLGSSSAGWKYGQELMVGNISFEEFLEVEQTCAPTVGTCNDMGTASTMTALAEVLGCSLPGASSVPAVDALGMRLAFEAGRRIVEMAWCDLKPSDVLTEAAFRNAAVVCAALGGSTNAAIHLIAVAGRAGVKLSLDDLDAMACGVPVLANVHPSGEYLMEDFYWAGGLRALLSRIQDRLALGCATVNGQTLGENIQGAKVHDANVIRPLTEPIAQEALAVLRGNLAPDGCVIKPSAARPSLLRHQGRAVVFEDVNDLNARIHDPDLEVDETSVLILRNEGPRGGPGMPECGMLPIPQKLALKGVRDMVRISDARMSGTSYGTCILHVSPEAYVGGPLALVKTGDVIDLDVPARRIDIQVSQSELDARRSKWKPPKPQALRGYQALFAQHVTQAHLGCDFEYLAGSGGVPEPDVHL
jgi:dihydroxy-acid dehydratase